VRGGLGRRVALLESRMGANRFEAWTDCQLVERINEICGQFRAAGFDAPGLDPACPDPEILDGFIAEMTIALA
jgi:hypothetical protein